MTAQPDIAADGSAAKQNAAIVARLFAEVLATGENGRALGFLADDFVDHDSAANAPSGGAGATEKLAALWRAFPDGRFTHWHNVDEAGLMRQLRIMPG